MEESAQKGAAMVRQVLTFARGMDGERTIVYVDRLLQELVRLVRDTFDRKIRVMLDAPDYLWPILGDATQLHQLLLNLCVNARDAMPDGGELRLSAANIILDAYAASLNPGAKPGQYVIIKVSDNGTGIPKAIRDRIFDPFFTTKEVGKGTGLGLSTAQAVVKSHGGLINVYSEEGRGTEFRIYLPATLDESDDQEANSQTQVPHGHGELVLVVDDEERVRQVTQQSLEAFGYRVLVAEDGADALSVYLQHRAEIAIVLTDMMMPVMDGLMMIQALRRIDPKVKIVAASGLADNGTVAKAANAGVQYFLPKPYAVDIMLRVLAEVLGTGGSKEA
jgi:CheY-like chemotaxis protein